MALLRISVKKNKQTRDRILFAHRSNFMQVPLEKYIVIKAVHV